MLSHISIKQNGVQSIPESGARYVCFGSNKKQDHSDSAEDFIEENLVHIQTPDMDDLQNLMGNSVFKDNLEKNFMNI